jgi:hypothetical protein
VAAQRARLATTILLCAAAALGAGGLIAQLTISGHFFVVTLLAGVVLLVIVWRRPEVGMALFVLVATLVEQFPIDQFPLSKQPALIVTDQIPFFASYSTGFGLSGLLVSPLEITLVVAVLIWLLKAVGERKFRFPRSYLAIGMAVLVVILAFGELQGLAHGGNFRETVEELRPWVYLVLLYLVASQLLERPGAIRPVLWAFTIGTGIKGLQGTIRFLALRDVTPRPEAILAHEEAVFFSLFVIFVAALWLFNDRSRLRLVATALLPTVLVADLGNGRRAAWLILFAVSVALAVVAWIRLPDRRRLLSAWAGALAVAGLVYLPLFWNGNGGLAQPARAIRSLVTPSSRDNLSDRYRVQEDANLKFNIELSGPLGAGFGVPIDYALPITNLLKTTPSLAFVPHDGILYLWMRLGIAGIVAFWWLIGAAILAACQLVRSRDRRLALFGGFALCALIAYVLEGYYDLGLSWFRIAVVMGIVLGALEAATRLNNRAATGTSSLAERSAS